MVFLRQVFNLYGLLLKISFLFCSWQISLLEMPEHRRKKMTSTTNVMRDDSDKVEIKCFMPYSINGFFILSTII